MCKLQRLTGVRMAFIDSELAKRRKGNATASSDTNGDGYEGFASGTAAKDGHIQRQPAALGKLHEIDLGPDATLRNIARTEAAKRRLEGGGVIEIEEGVQKVRLRRDGKPWRGRKRRNSEDVKRDKLVEEVMRESRRTSLLSTLNLSMEDVIDNINSGNIR